MAFIWILLLAVSTSDCLSIGVKQNVTKRQVDGDFFPDWVPFKNKHGAELGEFIDVAKSKPKKRLALPVNFIMKAVAESEGDDYYDKGQGGSDSDDYYEKKEWSDQHRPANAVDPKKLINHTDISDIDGIVDIITKPRDDLVLKAIQQRIKLPGKNRNDKPKRENEKEILHNKDSEEFVIEVSDKNSTTDNPTPKNEDTKQEKILETSAEESEETEEDEEKDEKENKNKKDEKGESGEQQEENNDAATKSDEKEDSDDEQSAVDKAKEDAEKSEKQRESEARKAKILSTVDELKERHAEEQRSISEKMKEEEQFEEELERELERSGKKREDEDKYAHPGSRWKKLTHDLDDYEDNDASLEDKYKISSFKSTTTTQLPREAGKRKHKSNKSAANGKLSVFRNPNLYTVNDEEDYSTTTPKSKKVKSRRPEKFSSKYTAQDSAEDENIRISLVPLDDSKEGEPTLFFPKKRSGKRRLKVKTTTPTPDTTADSSEEKTDLIKEPPITDSYAETSPSAPDAYSSASNTATAETGPEDTAPSASDVTDTAPSASDVTDAAQASTDKKEEKKSDDYHRESGGEKEHFKEHDETHEEHGKKAYEGVHKDAKTNKGHHDKENHLDKYDDHGGIDKHHHKEDKHYGSHHHEEHGKKHAKYEESGKHSKGHSTKGSHDIHKKEEYEKKVEFFEEEGDSDDEENEGGYHREKEHSSGGHFKKGELDAGYKGHSQGEKGEFAKGGHGNFHKGHKTSGGHDSHVKYGKSHHKAEGHDSGKKWVYHHGYPAKNANLVIIDRRADAYQHGPRYFG
ncbi:histone acetyltransferase KAT6B-like [Melitaea cinxia]|uniref:histone acetyltransferase KAT6B-like n=1 Tax=Melitaea cinxia TaxID=113334 RepID=UPI001E270635|nr:histone acetyltransferase KAT6B-like [Melitaea cinxia]